MNINKKIIITGIILGAVIIVLIFTLNLARLQFGKHNLPGNATYNSSPESSIYSDSNSRIIGEKMSVSEPKITADLEESLPETSQKIIKSGNLTLKVSDADKAVSQITTVAKNNGGDIFSSNLYEGSNNMKSGTVTIKVPVANFEKAFAEIKKVGSLVVRESISGQDVTEQYADLQSRLKNKQAEEKAFIDILQRSGEIDDVLKVTKELSRVRGEIEVLQGRIKLLESQTDMSTITVQISEDAQITITNKWRPLQVTKEAFNSLFRDIQRFINFAIILLVRIIPVLIVYLLFVWMIYLAGRRIYFKIKGKKQSGTP